MKQARVRTESMVQRYAKKPISEGYDLWDRDYPLGALRLFTFKAETAPPFQLAPCLDATAEIAFGMNGLEDAREQFLLAMDKYKLLQQALLAELMRIKVVEIDRGAVAALNELRALLLSVDPQQDGSGAPATSSASSSSFPQGQGTNQGVSQSSAGAVTAVMGAGARRQTSLARCYAYLAELLLDTAVNDNEDGEANEEEEEKKGENNTTTTTTTTDGGIVKGDTDITEQGNNHRYYDDGATKDGERVTMKTQHEAECAQVDGTTHETNTHSAIQQQHSRAENIAEAIRFASLAVKLGWDRVHMGYIALGDAFVEAGEWAKAHEAYAQALQRCPRCVAAVEKQIDVVKHLLTSDNNDNVSVSQAELMRLLDSALEAHPRAEWMREKAFLLCETASENEALNYLDACLAQPPQEEIESVADAKTKTLATLLKAKAAILADAERLAEALQAARDAAAAHPRDAEASRLVEEIASLIK